MKAGENDRLHKGLAIVLFVFSVFFIITSANAAKRPIVAVFQIQDKDAGLNKRTLSKLTEYLRTAISEGGAFRVVSQGDIRRALLKKKKETYKECYDQKCQIELGRELAANKSLSTSVLKIGGECVVTSQLYDLKTQTTDISAKSAGKCSESGLMDSLDKVASKIRAWGSGGYRAGFKEGKIGEEAREFEPGGGEEVIARFESSPPGATVLVDGKILCKETPCSKSLASGPHHVSMQAERYLERGERVVVARGIRLNWTLDPNFGWLTVETEPEGIEVKINGEPAGKSPISRKEVSPGGYEVVAVSPCHFEKGERMKIDRNQEREVSLKLQERQGAVKVSAKDKDGNDLEAEVLVDGVKVGLTPGTYKVSVCAKKLEVKHRKHGTARKSLRIREHNVTPVELTLELDDLGKNIVNPIIDETGFILVKSNPTGAKVLINGEEMGNTPYQAVLMVGVYVVVCKKDPHYFPARKRINLTTKGARLRMELKPKNVSSPVKSKAGLLWLHSKPAGIEFTKNEVTVAQYRACVETGRCTEPKSKSYYKYCNWGHSGRDNHPINCVDWNQANSFCECAGGRLPTEDEWYAEASNNGKREFPWGNQGVTCDYAVKSQGGKRGCGRESTWPVCSKPVGNSVSGLCDMSGNVDEWTSSWYDNGRKYRVVRGGSWNHDDPDRFRAGRRSGDGRTNRGTGNGFRCVRSLAKIEKKGIRNPVETGKTTEDIQREHDPGDALIMHIAAMIEIIKANKDNCDLIVKELDTYLAENKKDIHKIVKASKEMEELMSVLEKEDYAAVMMKKMEPIIKDSMVVMMEISQRCPEQMKKINKVLGVFK